MLIDKYRFPADHYYDERSHVWVAVEDDGRARIGVDDFEQEAAGTYQRLMLKEEGEHVERGEELINLESSKFVGSKASPVSGEIVDVNMDVVENPHEINRAPYENWLVRVDLADRDELDALLTGEDVESWASEEVDEMKQRTTAEAE